MFRHLQFIVVLALTTIVTACGDSNNDNNGQAASGESLSDSARFEKDFRKKGCELLTAELVSATFDIPAGDFKQTKVMGCYYTWSNDAEKVEAGISMIRAHKSEAAAAQWFTNATKSKSVEEMQAEMAKVAEQVEKNEALDTPAKKSAAKSMLAIVGSKAIVFEDVAAVGDEARINDTGTLTVRIDNLTFNVSAYQGADEPELDLKGAKLNEMTKIAKEHSAKWAEETAPQRKQDSSKLAKAIIASL